jgi:hypothetical protein
MDAIQNSLFASSRADWGKQTWISTIFGFHGTAIRIESKSVTATRLFVRREMDTARVSNQRTLVSPG